MIRHLRFVSSRSRFQCRRWHLGLFSFYTHAAGERRSGLAIHLRGLLLWTLGMTFIGYFGTVSVLFVVWDRDPGLDLGYGEMLLLPYRWHAIQQRRAKSSVNAGLQALNHARWSDAEILIRSGFQRDPSLLDGRTQLATFYLAAGRWSQGSFLLAGGFSHRYPGLSYIQNAFAVAQSADDLKLSTTWCRQLLDRFGKSMPAADRSWLLVREAQLLLAQGQYRALIALTSAPSTSADTGMRELRTLALLKLGDWSQALSELNLWLRMRPEDALLITCLRAQTFRIAGRLEEMDMQLDRACSMAPSISAVFLFASSERFQAGQLKGADEALGVFLARFGQNYAVVDAAMQRLFELKDRNGMDRILRFARERGRPLKQLLISKAVFDLTETNIDQSRLLFRELDSRWNRKSLRELFLRDYFERLDAAATDPGEGPRLLFEHFCREHSLEWSDFFCAVGVLVRFHREKAAMKVLEVALERYPDSYHLAALKMKIQATPYAQSAQSQ